LEEAAHQLGVPAKTLRALEWDRRDLLAGAGDVERLERRYAWFLGMLVEAPASPEEEPLPRPRRPRPEMWVAILAALAPLLVIGIAFLAAEPSGDAEGVIVGVTVGLSLLSSLLLAGSVLPPGVVARTPVSAATLARYRQPLALAAVGILVPVVVFALLVGLS
jgi:hypothetical protein